MTAVLAALGLMVAAVLWAEGRRWECPDCKGMMDPVGGWRKATCIRCGKTWTV